MTLSDTFEDIRFIVLGILGMLAALFVAAIGIVFVAAISQMITSNSLLAAIIFVPMAFGVAMGVAWVIIVVTER